MSERRGPAGITKAQTSQGTLDISKVGDPLQNIAHTTDQLLHNAQKHTGDVVPLLADLVWRSRGLTNWVLLV